MIARKRKIIILVFAGLCSLFTFFAVIVLDAVTQLYLSDTKPLQVSDEKFITADPFNVEQIVGISKFRSCQGHEYSGKGMGGALESSRSMKHYIVPRDDISEKLGTIEIRAPFDGYVAFGFPGTHGDEMVLSPDSDESWGFLVFHVDPLPGIRLGSKFKSGQLIGHANVKGRHDFDIGLQRTNSTLIFEKLLNIVRGNPQFMFPKSRYLVSPFDYMTDKVLAEFKAAGFNTNDLEYTDEHRDKNPCDFDRSASYPNDWQYLPGHSPYEKQKQRIQKLQEQDPPQKMDNPPILYP